MVDGDPIIVRLIAEARVRPRAPRTGCWSRIATI